MTSWWRSCVLVTGLAVILSAQSQTADAQPAAKSPRIGILSAGPLPPRKHQWEAFRQGLRELGYVEGENIVFVDDRGIVYTAGHLIGGLYIYALRL